MVRTVFSADVYVNKMQLDSRHFNRLVDSIHRIDSSGIIYSPEQKLDIVLKEINSRPNRFFRASMDYIKEQEKLLQVVPVSWLPRMVMSLQIVI